MTKLILFVPLSVLSAFAGEPKQPLGSNLEAAQVASLSQQPNQAMPTAPVDLQGKYQVENAYGVTLSGSALYWKAYEEELDYVIKNTGATAINNGGEVERAAFDWNWGFRVDLGYEIPKKKMDLDLCWTSYRTEGTVSDSVASPVTLFSVWSIPNQAGTAFEFQSNAHAHLSINILDFGMSATFAPRRFLDITPFIDLSAARIHQKIHFNLSGGPGVGGLTVVDDSIQMKNDFWGIGPKLGINTLWDLGWGFGICGDFNLSLLYGFFDITQNEAATFRGTVPNTFLDIERNKFHLPRLNFDLFLGMRWDRMFCSNRCHLLFEAGWENLIFLGQIQLMRFVNQDNSGINVTSKGDLALQGLSMRATFTF